MAGQCRRSSTSEAAAGHAEWRQVGEGTPALGEEARRDRVLLGRRHDELPRGGDGPDLQAGVPYYGAAADTASVPKIKAPLLVHLAENDPRINEMYPTYEQELKKAGVRYEIHSYPGTQHGTQLDAALQRGGGEALVGAHHRVLQEEPRLAWACRRAGATKTKPLRRCGGCALVVGDERDMVMNLGILLRSEGVDVELQLRARGKRDRALPPGRGAARLRPATGSAWRRS